MNQDNEQETEVKIAAPLPPDWAKGNPFAYLHGDYWVQIVPVNDRITAVRSFTLAQCRQALALWDIQKGVSVACVRRIKEIYRGTGMTYPTPDDTLCFLRRMDAGGEMPIPFINGLQTLIARICAMEGCAPASASAECHRNHLAGLLLRQNYLRLDPTDDTITFQEVSHVTV